MEFKRHVKVYARARPLHKTEIDKDFKNILTIIPTENQISVEDGSKGIFTYDGVFDEGASQEELFEKAVHPLLSLLNKGQNVTAIAYGQTGSGKTYTMGTSTDCENNEGILQRAIKILLQEKRIKSSTPNREEVTKCLKIKFFEIYNNTMHDLFNSNKIITAKPDGYGGVIPIGCEEETAYTADEALNLIKKGNCLRKMASTVMNAHSSRSHALISIRVVSEDDSKENGILTLVDLAGSEGVGRNHIEGKEFCEGVSINKGLLAIGKVLAALSSNKSSSHIPYRDSMITRLLREGLGGESHTVMIACVNPSSSNAIVTVNTLRFAEQARSIKHKLTGIPSIKSKSVKRPSDDISATPGAWRKFLNKREKTDINSTISTPGYKPLLLSKNACRINNTFATPLNKVSSTDRKSASSNYLRDTVKLPTFTPFNQPIFESDSPTESIIEPVTMNSTIAISPFVEKVNSRLEKSIFQIVDKQVKVMGEEITQNLLKTFFHGGEMKRRRQSQRLLMKEKSNDENADPSESSEYFPSLPEAFASAFTKKPDFLTNALKSVFKEHLPYFNKTINSTPVTTPIHSSVNNTNIASTIKKCFEKDALPITSTAFVDKKNIRKSKRLTTKSTSTVNLDMSNIENCLNQIQDDTYICASPHLKYKNTNSISVNNLKSEEIKVNNIIDENNVNDFKCDNMNVNQDKVLGAPQFMNNTVVCVDNVTMIRRTSRRSALKAIQLNHNLLNKEKRNLESLDNTITKTKTTNSPRNWTKKRELIIKPSVERDQKKQILKILNIGSLRELQRLPTIGPKTAMVIHNFRLAYGKFEKIEDLKDVPALSQSFYNRFIMANLVSQAKSST